MQEKDNYLKNAELEAEQNYNMIDGILNNEPTPVPEPGQEPLGGNCDGISRNDISLDLGGYYASLRTPSFASQARGQG